MDPGARYERYMGRWSRLIARQFVAWLAPAQRGRWLDVGCGTGALSSVIAELAAPSCVRGIDPDAEYIDYARAGASTPCEFQAGDVASLSKLHAPAFDYAICGLALNQFPDPTAGLRHMAGATHAGGTVAAYVWDFAEGMGLFRVVWDAARSLDPAARAGDPGEAFPICRPQPLREAFRDCGLRQVRWKALSTTMDFASFEEFWEPMQAGHGRNGAYVASLPAGQRLRLRDRVRAALSIRTDGSLRLTARAWAVRGDVPDLAG